ncbi:lytic transglycosylase domain-containing protein [Methylocapsa acidiphila]|uniref:lytic transglycosylase domain-containing protein n=1 Tax=Methylocapsa acidiphila TaxID=133552 RepID=UPI0004154416|nr:transglycosylase SLT domain-containing protein [Methylocapsa acidiphila]
MGLLFGGLMTLSEIAAAEGDPPQPPARPSEATNALKAVRGAAESVDAAEARNPDARYVYRALLKKEAEKRGLPLDIADSVMAIESGYDPSAIGTAGEIGLMQVMPSTAAMLGFKGDDVELAKPEVNIRFGVAYLAEAWRLANGDLCRALMKYRAGHGEEEMSALSIAYCGRARAHLAAIGSSFANGVSVPIALDWAEPRPRPQAARRGPRIRTAAVSRAFWAAHDARVKAITARIEAKWRKMASR